ncbi:hypothetical protein ACFQ9Z_37780 [Streptomyces sp. NPDC056580]|uniref:hypothetical protein n=1 Tax=Streptomyces sp. NPDC056580 TaxID=3345872 RepID=UPI0036BE819F
MDFSHCSPAAYNSPYFTLKGDIFPSSSGKDQAKASDPLAAAGIPAAPTGQARTDLLAALRKANPAL